MRLANGNHDQGRKSQRHDRKPAPPATDGTTGPEQAKHQPKRQNLSGVPALQSLLHSESMASQGGDEASGDNESGNSKQDSLGWGSTAAPSKQPPAKDGECQEA